MSYDTVVISCASTWSWLVAATLLRDCTEESNAPSGANRIHFQWEKRKRTREEGSIPSSQRPPIPSKADIVIVLLGNLPINATTMTVDMYERMKKAASEYCAALCSSGNDDSKNNKQKRVVIICCGGKSLYTFQGDRYGCRRQPCLSEAEMMAAWLLCTGKVARQDLVLEDVSMTTSENGAFASALIEQILDPNGEVVLVSKSEHLQWAPELFQRYPLLKTARLAGATVDKQKLMDQLKSFADAGDVFALRRWEYLRDGVTGLD